MSRFVAWNDLLLSEFFSAVSANEDVWIRATRAELDSFGLHLGGAEGLIGAVRSGAPWLQSLPNCSVAARILVEQRRDPWRTQQYLDPGAFNPTYLGAFAPAYLPILALWVLAASDEQTEGGFYASVQRLLGKPFKSEAKITEAMSRAWEDLEAWSSRECDGRFGRFHCRVLGEHRFVGIPRSQGLISRQDGRNLFKLFWDARLRPGQVLTDGMLASLLAHGCESPFLTRPLRSAMAKPEYLAPLAALLQKLLESWDGSRPKGSQVDADQSITGPLTKEPIDAKTSVTLVLLPSEEVPNGWDVCWSFPAVVDTLRCRLEISGQPLPAVLNRASACFLTDVSEHHVRQSLAALSASASMQIEVLVQLDDDSADTFGDQYRKELIRQTTRRILGWNSIDPRFGQQLIERDIPLYGVFYLVCAPADWARTDPWLRREQISFEPMEVSGLPSGWRMACIQRAERLTAEHRQYLADASEATDVSSARLRLVGGGRLLRGGARLFAPYDLPAIELEGPPGAFLEAPGLQLSEVPQHTAKEGPSGVRRFLVHVLDLNCRSFDIRLVDGRAELASTRLRVADPDGEGRGTARDFSLDSLGFPISTTEGLRGNRIGGALQGLASGVWRNEQMQEVPAIVKWAGESFAESGAAQFLDTLAARGSISYGAARDQVSRLCGNSNPISLLLDLRARGCLEIETDGKGHFVRIHDVAPSLYGLPATQDGLPLFGVSGTLRLAQWSLLQVNGNFIVNSADPAPEHLPALRVAAVDAHSVQTECSSMGFLFAPAPSLDVAHWAGSLRQARKAAESLGAETISAELGHLHRLKADSAQFIPVSEPRMYIDRVCGAQLFRFDDPQATALQLYVLGVRRVDGTSRYSHVPDSRWGIWISQLAFAEMLMEKHGRTDAFPWPLHYDPVARDLWVPARLRPPAVLERALALCSGAGPAIHFLSSNGNEDGRSPVFDGYVGRVEEAISHVYKEFVPGRWLRYRWVPAEVAQQVAELLGCTLEPFAYVKAISGSETLNV
ncbi:hypothetical protein [Alcaligenes faecalis]|uniref:hypothetical protein n=1 Tax=Alcaligenes faecalis TaxID=511 RepID=UPI001C837FB8|nr:hypothetical protein [Alcaligenes faecalis]MBX6964229.1 hypothetical protein [Providencia rettgeri]MBX7029394.1 hypothetical protein [Alcaligenes faecalis]